MMVSLDGLIEGPDKNIDWHVWDEEMSQFMGSFFNRVDTLLFGRVTYEMMLDFWPTATTEDPVITERMNNLPKIVFSRTLDQMTWNSRLIKENIPGEIHKLKQQAGKDMVLFGGADIATTLIGEGLIDEYQIIINPVVLRKGKPLFKGLQKGFKLNLIKSKSFNSGNVVLNYLPVF
ncbi:dihydrofolate reductase family protein [soil metagenome]